MPVEEPVIGSLCLVHKPGVQDRIRPVTLDQSRDAVRDVPRELVQESVLDIDDKDWVSHERDNS
jgi:hypothetical protein